MKHEYTYIKKLGIPIHYEGNVSHILTKDLEKYLTKPQQDDFNKFFGIQTCLLRKDGQAGLYLGDVELVLKQIFENYKPSIEEWD